MSARAASRLESLGFTVYRYQAGKVDWFAAGLPRQGTNANVPRVADVAARDVPTARLEDRVGDVRDRVALDAAEPLIVVNADRVVLGLVKPETLKGDPLSRIEEVMDAAPVTFRPNLPGWRDAGVLQEERYSTCLVTTSDGILVGLVHQHGVKPEPASTA
jgi:CBS domain-containing protein